MSARTSDYTKDLSLKKELGIAIKCKETSGQLKIVRNSYVTFTVYQLSNIGFHKQLSSEQKQGIFMTTTFINVKCSIKKNTN